MALLSQLLKNQEYCLLATFRKSGQAVASPLWFVLEGEAAYMTTRGKSWKVKRLSRNPRVTITWCNSGGNKHGKPQPAKATLVEDRDEFERAVKSLNKKYGLKKKLIDFGLRFAKDKTEAIIKVELDEPTD